MSAPPNPTVRSRRLRYELKRLRAAAGLTIEEAARRAGVDKGTLSRWESGRRRVRPGDVLILAGIYGVPAEHAEILVILAREAGQRGWWQDFGTVLPDGFEVYLGMEAEAESIRDFQLALFPGLLQTPDYYRAFMKSAPAAGDDETIARRAEVRAERQKLLDGPGAPNLWAVLDENVLRRPVGGPDVMRAQVHHVIGMAMRDRVTVQVLPFSAGAHQAMDGSFIILGFAEQLDPDLVYSEDQVSNVLREGQQEVARYDAMWSHLVAKAASPERSAVMLAEAAAALA